MGRFPRRSHTSPFLPWDIHLWHYKEKLSSRASSQLELIEFPFVPSPALSLPNPTRSGPSKPAADIQRNGRGHSEATTAYKHPQRSDSTSFMGQTAAKLYMLPCLFGPFVGGSRLRKMKRSTTMPALPQVK